MTYLSQELAGDGVKSLFWPGSEPVNRCAVNQTRKVSATSLECIPNRRHGQNNVEIVGCFLNKVRPHSFFGVRVVGLCSFIPHLHQDRIKLGMKS